MKERGKDADGVPGGSGGRGSTKSQEKQRDKWAAHTLNYEARCMQDRMIPSSARSVFSILSKQAEDR